MEDFGQTNQEASGADPLNPSLPSSPQTSVPQVTNTGEQPQIPVFNGSISPSPAKPKKRILIVFILFIFVVVLLTALYLVVGKNNKTAILDSITQKSTADEKFLPSEPKVEPTQTPQVVEGIDGWLEYKKEGEFSFKYPPEAQIKNYDDGTISVSIWGPTQQENTEFYDGLSMSFRVLQAQGKSLKESADESYLELKDLFESSQPIISSVGNNSGYTFHVKGYIDADYYFVEINPDLHLEIINATKDPTEAGFILSAEKILMTLVLTP